MNKEKVIDLQEKLIGQKLVNRMNEEGQIISFDNAKEGAYMFVAFESRKAQFKFPSAFYGEFLTLLDAGLTDDVMELGKEEALEQAKIEEEKKRKAEEEKALRMQREKEKYQGILNFRESEYQSTNTFQRKLVKPAHDDSVILSTEQQEALDIMNQGRSVFLSGSAGAGKSAILREFIFENHDKNIITLAPTGIAAVNVEGETIHRVFKVDYTKEIHPGDYNKHVDQIVVDSDIIIIDEISMCRFDLFEYVIRTIRAAEEIRNADLIEKACKEGKTPALYPGKQLIFVGDFYQLPPVVSYKDRAALEQNWGPDYPRECFAFQSQLWDELGLVNIILHENNRQNDAEFSHHLNMIRVGNADSINWINSHAKSESIEGAIYLLARNDDVDKLNEREINKIVGESRTYKAKKEGLFHQKTPAEKSLLLKIGMRVIALANNADLYQNGLLGTVAGFGNDFVTVAFDNGYTARVYTYTWNAYEHVIIDNKIEKEIVGTFTQIPLKAAYAITIHRAQGQTYDKLNLNPYSFNPGQLYVALSRVRNVENLSLIKPISKEDLRTSEVVTDFYNRIDRADLVL